MIRRLLAWLDRILFAPREPHGLGPTDVGRYEHPQAERNRIATVVALNEAEKEREATMLRVLQKSNTHKLLGG